MIEKLQAVPVPKESYGKFFTGDSYIILKITALKNGSFRHNIHYWLGKDTCQDEAGTPAIKTVELDAALGGRAVQYHEVQGNETEKFLSYFKPCIIPEEGSFLGSRSTISCSRWTCGSKAPVVSAACASCCQSCWLRSTVPALSTNSATAPQFCKLTSARRSITDEPLVISCTGTELCRDDGSDSAADAYPNQLVAGDEQAPDDVP